MSTSYLNRLGEIDFSRTIERLAEGFTGREWLFTKLDEWLNQENGEQFYLLTGEPGVGKSAIAAQLTQRWADKEKLAAYHFCRAGDVETVRPGRVLRSLATQLGKTLPHYGEALKQVLDQVHVRIDVNINIDRLSNSQVTGIYVENLKDLDPREEFRLLIQAPLAALSNIYETLKETPPSLKVFLIDSLDEAATTTGQENMATLLASLYQARETLPPWVRFLLTARPDGTVLSQFLPLQSQKIEELEDDNLGDIQLYIQGRVDEEIRGERSTSESPDNTAIANLKPLQQRLEEADLTTEKLVKEVKALSHGNFLYTKLLLNSIASGEQSIKNLSALPKTLNDIYHRILRYRCSFRGWLKRYQPILGTLSVTQEPVSQAQLSKFIGIDATELGKDLDVFRQFLDESEDQQGQETYSIFHQSLREYLLDRNHNHDFWCDAQEEHGRIIEHYHSNAASWDALDWSTVDIYGLLHLAKHSYAQIDIAVSRHNQHEVVSKYRQNLYDLICKSLMEAKLAQFESHELFSEDVKLAITIAQTESPPNIVQQFRHSLIYATLGALATNVPPEVIGALVRVGELRKAQGFAALVPDAAQRSRAWLQISEIVMGAVQKAKTTQHESEAMLTEVAKDSVMKAVQAAETIQDEAQRAEIFVEVAASLVQVDDREGLHQVLEAAIAIIDEEYRVKTLGAIAKALAQVGDVDGLNLAFKAAEQIEQVTFKVRALSEVGLALAQVGDNQKLHQTLLAVEQIERIVHKVDAIRSIASSFARLEDIENLNRIREIIDAFKLSNEEIIEEDEADDWKLDDEIFLGIHDPNEILTIFYKVQALAYLSLAIFQTASKEKAIQWINEALILEKQIAKSKPTIKAEMLSEIGRAVAQIGDRDSISRLLSATTYIDDNAPQDIMMRKIGLALAEAGDVEGICHIIELLRTEFFGLSHQAEYNLVGIPEKIDAWEMGKSRRRKVFIFDANNKVKNSRQEKLIAEILGQTIESLDYSEFSEQFNQDSTYVRRFNPTSKYSHSGDLGWEVKVIEIVKEEYRSEIFAKQIINWAPGLLLNGNKDVVNRLEKLSASDQIKAIKKLAPQVVQVVAKQNSSKILYSLLTLVEVIEDPTLRRDALAKLAMPFAQIRDKEILKWLLAAVQVIEAETTQSKALTFLASTLAKLASKDTLKQAISIASVAKNDSSKRRILLDVFEELASNQSENNEELSLIQTVAETINCPDLKLEILLNLALHLNVASSEVDIQNEIATVLMQAINIFDKTEFKHYQEKVLNLIIECIMMFRFQVLLPWALEAVEKISGLDDRVKLLDKLIQALAALEERDGLSQALSLIVALEDKKHKAKLLGIVAEAMAVVDGDLGFVEVLGIAGEEFAEIGKNRDHEQRMLDCSCYALFLSKVTLIERKMGTQQDVAEILEVQKGKVLASLAVVRSRYLESEEECKTAYECIERVIPSLVQIADEEMWQIVFIVTQQIEREDFRAKALCELAKAFVSPINLQQLNWVINTARTIRKQEYKTDLLSTTAFSLSQMGDQASLSYALNIVNSLEDGVVKTKTLTEISQVLAEAEDREGLYQVIDAAQALCDEQSKTEIESKVIRYLYQLGDEAGAFSTWNLQLTNAHLNGRSAIFHTLSAGIPFISNTDQGKTLWQLYEALTEVESWWSEPKNQKILAPKPEEASTLIDIGRQYLQQDQWLKALECFEKSLAISRQVGNQQDQALALHYIGQVYLKQKQWAEAIKYLKQDLALCYELNNVRGQAQNLSNLAVAYTEQNLQAEAIKCLMQSLSVMHQLGFQEGDSAELYDLAATFYNLGSSYKQLEQLPEAIESFEKALAIYRRLDDAEEIADALRVLIDLYGKNQHENEQVRFSTMARYFKLLADILYSQGRWSEGIKCYEGLLYLLRQLGDVAGEAAVLQDMGTVFCDQGAETEAIQCYEQSLTIARQIKNLEIEYGSLLNLGTVYNEQQQWAEAEQCFQQSLAIVRQMGALEEEADLLHHLGGNYTDQERWAEAIPYCEKDLEIRRELGDYTKVVLIISNLIRLYSLIGNKEKATTLRQEVKVAIGKIDPNSPDAKEAMKTARRFQAGSEQ